MTIFKSVSNILNKRYLHVIRQIVYKWQSNALALNWSTNIIILKYE